MKTAAIVNVVPVAVLFIVFAAISQAAISEAMVSEGVAMSELQFLLAAFLAFFMTFAGLIAWIFSPRAAPRSRWRFRPA